MAAPVVSFLAHPELFLPLVVIAALGLALAAAVKFGRHAAAEALAAATDALVD